MSRGRIQRPIMPRLNFPPTPAPSTDITGKTNPRQIDVTFSLPPAAIAASRGSTSSSAASNASDSSYRPISPTSPAATSKSAPVSRKRSNTKNATIITKEDYSLPPPPTRSRKIIQMQPKDSQEPAKQPPVSATTTKTVQAAGSKRKQAGSNTAQGRKIARKTAHSLIERRRRSKMNEEFGVLKDMIPACAGQEMHKLAILQASIDYMRYLEQCVADLKSSHRSHRDSPTPTSPKQPPSYPAHQRILVDDDDDDEEDVDEDVDMDDAVSPTQVVDSHATPKQTYPFTQTSPATCPSERTLHSTTTSPNMYPSDARPYSATASPAMHPSDPRHYSLASSIRSTATSPSVQASPAFGGHTPSQSQFHNPFSSTLSSKDSIHGPGLAHFALTSPALGPQTEREDHEATEALLMLNTDRRNWAEKDKRGISVNDLLTR